MREGGMSQALRTSAEERVLSAAVGRLDDFHVRIREKLRTGERLGAEELEWLR